MTEDHLFDLVCDDVEDSDFRSPEKYIVTVLDAINYIAYGRFDGAEQPRHWADYEEAHVEHDVLMWYGARNVACRVLSHKLATGELRAHVVDTIEEVGDEPDGEGGGLGSERLALYAVKASAFASGAGIYFYGGALRSQQFTIHSDDDTITISEALFFASDIKRLASPGEGIGVAPIEPQPTTRPAASKGGRKAGKNGAPIAGYIKRLDALGYERVGAETHETLGAWLREEYAVRGLHEPHEDNAKRDAVGAMRDWFGIAGGGETSAD